MFAVSCNPMTSPQNSPTVLLDELSRLMNEFPTYAAYVKTARQAIIGALSPAGPHGLLVLAIAGGARTYADLQERTGFSPSYLHRNLSQLVNSGLLRVENEPPRGKFRPRKLFFLSENKLA